jgi:photosystem II stability/assembly factor-like uncharacterized protein
MEVLMKNFTTFLVFLLVALLSITVWAQNPWVLQRAFGLPNSVNPAAQYTALDDSVCWGISSISPLYLRTTNGGQNWTVATITGATGGSASITAIDANTAWVCNFDAVYKTTDGGLTWDEQETAFQGFSGHPNAIHFFDSNNGVCVGNPNNGYWAIYTTIDGGTNWIRVPSANIPAPIPANETGLSIIAVANGNSFWFTTLWGALYRTTDRGMTWTVARDIFGNLDGFACAFKDNLNGLACTFIPDNMISKTSDGGTTWTAMDTSGLSGLSLFYIAYAKGTSGSYVITSHYNVGGAFTAIPGTAYTIDNGYTWKQVDSLPHGRPSFSSGINGWSAGMNDSVYKWVSDILVTSVEEINSIAETFTLKQNYPNPFNPNTTIQFQIPNASFVNLKVYDILGNEVAVLVNEEKSVGSYEVEFNAAALSSGIYFYMISAGSFVETKKMILMK